MSNSPDYYIIMNIIRSLTINISYYENKRYDTFY